MATVNSVDKFDVDLLESIFRTSKKTIQEYVQEIERYCRFKSVQHQVIDGTVLDDRSRLIDLYEACVQQDAHLASVLETLNSQIIGERYMLARQNEKGKYIKDVEETKKVQGTQFIKIIKGIVESKLYGYTVLEILPDIDSRTQKLKEVNIIERRNVLPDQHRIVRRQGIWNPGWDLESFQYQDNYVLINSGNLGLFSATTPSILAKKFTVANYVNFSHTYGQPIIHGKTVSEAPADRKRLANDISSAAQNKVIVTGLEDEVDIKTFTMSNSEHVFTGLIDIVNKDISNIILGSESMAGGTQSYVGSTRAHQDIFRDRVEVYREYIENIMNEQVIPRLVKMRYIKPGLEFKYAKRLEMSDKDQIDLYSFLVDKYEIASDEIEKTFGVVVGRQLNLAIGGRSGSPTGGGNDDVYAYRMSDKEYYQRYGHERNVKNFLLERK
jgi:phage gp29-like protein